jgi:hypothetical protein
MLARFCYLKTEFFCALSSQGVGSTLLLPPPPLHTKYTLAHNVRTAAISFISSNPQEALCQIKGQLRFERDMEHICEPFS